MECPPFWQNPFKKQSGSYDFGGMPRGTIGILTFSGVFMVAFSILLTYAFCKRQKPGTQTLNRKDHDSWL